jgi:hypothetical protein
MELLPTWAWCSNQVVVLAASIASCIFLAISTAVSFGLYSMGTGVGAFRSDRTSTPGDVPFRLMFEAPVVTSIVCSRMM